MTDSVALWNDAIPWPKSWDGTPAIRVDKLGNENPKGKFIKWYEKDKNNDLVLKIAKLFKANLSTEPLDYEKMRKEVVENPRYDINNHRAYARMRARLLRVYMKFGVSYIDALNITRVFPGIDTACWGTANNSEEFILINPYILMFRATWAGLILQHEVLHRALYRGRDNLGDRELVNVVLDICVNRILSATPNGKMSETWRKFCEWIYPQESKRTVLALANSSLSGKDLQALRGINPLYAQIWQELYGEESLVIEHTNKRTGKITKRKVSGKLSFKIGDLSPDDLYFRLRNQLTDEDKKALKDLGEESGLNPFGERAQLHEVAGRSTIVKEDAPSIATDRAARTERALRRSLVPKRLRRNLDWGKYSDCRTEFWEKFVKKPEDIYDPKLQEYAARIQTQKIMEDVAGAIIEQFRDDVVTQPYPHYLTEEGTMLAICGFRGNNFPFYQNEEGLHGRRRVVVFFDLSPSMQFFFPHMMTMCDIFEETMDMTFARNAEGDAGVMTFAGSVRELSSDEIELMRTGEIKVGCSTSFDEVVKYSTEKISTDDVDAIIIFTDGESSLSYENEVAFNSVGKRMYRIYCAEHCKRNYGRIISSDLDRLNGESYSLLLPLTDKAEVK